MTVLSDYIARMVAGGLDESEAMQIAAELFAAGAACQAERPSKAVLRTRKWRAKKASQTVTSDVQSAMSESVTNRHKPSQTVTCDNTPLSSSKIDNRKRGERLSPDWRPSPNDYDFAKQLGWSDGQIASESANFRDYWIAKPGSGGCKLDWPATWRKWVRSSKIKPANQPAATNGTGAMMDPEEAVKHFAKVGKWSRWAGPEPGMTGCRASAELLAKYGLAPDGRKLEALQ